MGVLTILARGPGFSKEERSRLHLFPPIFFTLSLQYGKSNPNLIANPIPDPTGMIKLVTRLGLMLVLGIGLAFRVSLGKELLLLDRLGYKYQATST